MIIADPFGSWVKGAHEGMQDAIALRNAQDRTAQDNYGLQAAAQADPLRLQLLRDRMQQSGIDTNLLQHQYDTGALQRIEDAKAVLAQLQPGLRLAPYGINQPLINTAAQNYGGTVGNGQLSIPVQGQNGSQQVINTPYGNIVAPQVRGMDNNIAFRNAQLGLGQERVDVQQQRANQAYRNAVQGANSFLNGLPDIGGQNTQPQPQAQPQLQPQSQLWPEPEQEPESGPEQWLGMPYASSNKQQAGYQYGL